MKNILKLSTLALIMILGFSSSMTAQVNDGDRSLVPVFKKGYRPQIGIAPVAGIQKTKDVDDLFFVYGVEISLQCPLYQCKKNHIRQQLSIVRAARDNFSSLSFELAPHYKLPIASSAEFGIGPHLGFQTNSVKVDGSNYNTGMFVYGLGGSLSYAFGKVFAGVDARYVWTTNAKYEILGVSTETGTMNNFRSLAKLGIRF